MNYKELVLSKSPSIYIPYDDGTNVDIAGAVLFQNITSDLNPLYDYTFKRMGARGKKIGQNGGGSYDSRLYRGSTSSLNGPVYYGHIEAWVYLPNTTYTDFVNVATAYARPTSSLLYPNQLAINTNRTIRWRTETNTGAQDHIMTSSGTVPMDVWTHIAVQIEYTSGSQGIKRIYINGILDSQISGSFGGGMTSIVAEAHYTQQTVWIDELAVWQGPTTTKPATFPTAADILQRATFPPTKTKWWDTATSSFITSADELYWNGTAWESMQDKTYQYWNGTSWVTL